MAYDDIVSHTPVYELQSIMKALFMLWRISTGKDRGKDGEELRMTVKAQDSSFRRYEGMNGSTPCDGLIILFLHCSVSEAQPGVGESLRSCDNEESIFIVCHPGEIAVEVYDRRPYPSFFKLRIRQDMAEEEISPSRLEVYRVN